LGARKEDGTRGKRNEEGRKLLVSHKEWCRKKLAFGYGQATKGGEEKGG